MHIFQYKWVPYVESLADAPLKTPLDSIGFPINLVSDLTIQNEGGSHWNRNLLNKLWDEEIVEQIENIPLRGSDIRCWGDEPVGSCSIKALYKALDKPPSGPHLPWKRLWVSKLPSKLFFFPRRVLQNRLPTGDKIHEFNPSFSPTCTFRHEEVESIDHLLIHCKVSKSIWSMIPNLNQKPTDFDNFFKWLWSKPTNLSKSSGIFVASYMDDKE